MGYPDWVIQQSLELYNGRSAAHARKALELKFKKEDIPEEYLPDERSIRRWYNKKLRDEHLEHLADIAKSILRGLEEVSENTPQGNEFDIHKYTIMHDDIGWGATLKQLRVRVLARIEEAEEQYCTADMGYFAVHLEAEFSDIEAIGFHKFARENPYELLQALKEPARTKKFKGKCPYCQHLGS